MENWFDECKSENLVSINRGRALNDSESELEMSPVWMSGKTFKDGKFLEAFERTHRVQYGGTDQEYFAGRHYGFYGPVREIRQSVI